MVSVYAMISDADNILGHKNIDFNPLPDHNEDLLQKS